MCIRENYFRILDGMADACAKANRRVEDVELIAVTKYVPVERIDEAVKLGIKSVGENRVQEFREKFEYFSACNLNVHLIGQLQTNKVKYVIGKVKLIQSVDREELAAEVSRLAVRDGVVQDVLVEVNIGDEPQKGGVPVSELPHFLQLMSGMPNVNAKGLMCIPPAAGADEARPYFAKMRRLFDDLARTNLPNVEMRVLSMGMSGDYTAAIQEGATMVRVGTALFGARK